MPPMTNVDPDLASLVAPYLARRRKEIDALRHALGAGDFGSIVHIGHRIRGSAGNLGFEELGKIAAELEIAASEKQQNAVGAQIERMVAFLDRTE